MSQPQTQQPRPLVVEPMDPTDELVAKNIRLSRSQEHQLRILSFLTRVPEAAIVRQALNEFLSRHRNELQQ